MLKKEDEMQTYTFMLLFFTQFINHNNDYMKKVKNKV